ncbi:unnamed protein product, partial [Polarella glacialis]
ASQLRSKTGAELLDASFAKKVAVAMANDQEVQHDAQALFVLGPSAAGKSHALRNGSVEFPRGALTLDGGFIRSVSTSWSKALDIAKSKRLGGLTNYFKDYFKAPMDKVKNQVVDEAIRSRANVVIPDTASDFKATTAMVSKLLAAGYSLRFMAVFADKEVCESRGSSRESEEGKKFSSKNWQPSVQSILDLQAYLESSGLLAQTGSVVVMSNTGVLHNISLADLAEKLRRERGSAALGASGS